MKSTKDFRGKGYDRATEDAIKKAVKLAPIKKSGKEKHMIYSGLDEEDDDPDLVMYNKKESVLDYFDDQEEDL